MCIFIKLGKHVNHDKRMKPIQFESLKSKVNVTLDLYSNNIVNRIESELFCASSSILAYILSLIRGYTLFKGRSLMNVGCTEMLRFALSG